MADLAGRIRERYGRALEIIATAARKSGRETNAVRLVVVTKLQPAEIITAAIEAGARILGENYPEEAAEKIEKLGPQSGVEWHMIGHVQSRKVQLVVRHFRLVHSLDSLHLAQRLDRAASQAGRRLPVLLEMNVGGEASKHGWQAAEETGWAALLPEINMVTALPNLRIRGLMTMPPLSTDPKAARPYFQKLRRLQEFLVQRVPQAEWIELSMGTSADYEVAVEEGATLVRVGQAILGPRPRLEGE